MPVLNCPTERIDGDHLRYVAGDASERPWGRWRVLEVFSGAVLKRIEVRPGGRLSLQLHHYRAEHWVVAQGTALVHVGNEQRTLTVGESVNIPAEVPHRLTNPGSQLLIVTELQVGDVLSEDDIVRLSDDFGRENG